MIKKKIQPNFNMEIENYNGIVDLIDHSYILHKKQIDSFKVYFNKKKSNAEKWFELVYSILVGTQIKTEKVKKCYDQLLTEYIDLLNPNFLIKLEDFNYLRDLIENSLRSNGYRFYKTKSITIYNTILFFQNYDFDLNYFLFKYENYKTIRKKLIEISGIGLKIASHWLRNIGFYIPVIDIHVKNLLFRFNVIENKNFGYQTYENLQNQIIDEIEIDNISFDLALWYYGKNFCGNKKCTKCKFISICRKNA